MRHGDKEHLFLLFLHFDGGLPAERSFVASFLSFLDDVLRFHEIGFLVIAVSNLHLVFIIYFRLEVLVVFEWLASARRKLLPNLLVLSLALLIFIMSIHLSIHEEIIIAYEFEGAHMFIHSGFPIKFAPVHSGGLHKMYT